ncbi:MAG: Unknown protein [uncultured Aureispira sp.]|uniref:Uncharacterized protein n=1 Tax=uncultured Aureispira sp. TaxID=1331704 RepID=A0A6S6TGL7_9BACT|nr:MAG: Unknown protein [uncultured Aureispira sp.]
MIKYLLLLTAVLFAFNTDLIAQEEEDKIWTVGGAVGLDFAQMLFINPKFGAGEDKIGVGGNISFFAKYKKERVSWDNFAGLTFGVQRLGSFNREIPFQKSVDELRIASNFSYAITDESPFGYSMDFLFLSQVTPTYDGNLLSPPKGSNLLPIAKFLAPATITVSPGIAYKKKTKFGTFNAMLSPASLKMIIVGDENIARQGLHGNPYSSDSLGVTEEQFRDDWRTAPDGALANGTGYYAHNYIQFGANLKAGYAHKFFKYTEDDKTKHRLVFSTSLNLYSNYLRLPQHIDVEWITNTDIFLFKGLSISLMTNLFWDYDVFVQVDADNDVTTSAPGTFNGYEAKERRVSFFQSLLVKYNFLF